MSEMSLQVQEHDAATTIMVTLVEGVEIQDAAEFETAGELLKAAAARAKEIESLRVTAVRPLNAQVQTINDLFRPSLDRLKKVVAGVKGMMARYTMRQRAEQTRLLQAAAAASAASVPTAALEAVKAAADALPPQVQGVSTRRVWNWTVVDQAQVPEEYLLVLVNKTKVDEAVKAGVREIPGIKIVEDVVVVARVG